MNCSVQDCDRQQKVKGLCGKHYQRLYKHGDVSFSYFSKEQAIVRFWERVVVPTDKTKCWEWVGSTRRAGYGQIRFEGKNRSVQQFIWFLEKGYFPTLFMLHHCDNPACVNPQHLYEGTHQDNVRDMVTRNRQLRGVTHNMAKLTENQVREIRERYGQGVKQPILGAMFGVTQSAISHIITGKRWGHII